MPHGAFRLHIDGGGRPRGRAHSGGSRKIEIAGSETRLDCARTGRTRMTQKSGETLSSTVPFSPQSQAPLHMGRSTVEGTVMKSAIVKRSVVINGHKTSISIEDQFWAALKDIAAERKLTVASLVSVVDHDRGEVSNLSSALRLFVLSQYYHPAASATSRRIASAGAAIATQLG
jgi:predicted DNA-binding ribbon-helix-helix protein